MSALPNPTSSTEPRFSAALLRSHVHRARRDPVWFAREIMQLKCRPGETAPGWELDPWQEELLEAIADTHRKQKGEPTKVNHGGKTAITVRAAQGPGKTFGIAVAAHWFGFCFDPCGICVVAPKLEHIKTRFFAEFNKIKARAIPGYSSLMNTQATRVYWAVPDPLNHLLIAETAKQPENIQGFRRPHTLYLIDESSGVEAPIWPVIDGNLSATILGVQVEIGNPTRNIGHFAQSHLRPDLEGEYYRMHVGPAHSRRIKPEWVAKMERRYGKNSPAVRVRCYGEFASSDSNQLIALDWIARARNRDGIDPMIGDGSQPRLRVSVDCAAGGDDETIVTGFRHFDSYAVGIKQRRFSFDLATASNDTANVAEQLFIELGGRKHIDDFVVDMLGVGVGAGGELIKRGYNVVMYQGGAASDNPVKWRNRRVQSYMALRNAFRDGTLILLETFVEESDAQEHWTDFDAQLCSIRTTTNERLEDLLTKDEMKRQGIKSPDMADSVAMQYATMPPATVPRARHERAAAQETEATESSVWDGL